MKIKQALEKLYSMHKFGVKLGLDNIRNLLQYLGNPHEKYRTVHVAGSNGKGSVSSFIASILQEEGKKVGLYTSPHFVRFNERVRINGEEIPDEYIADFISSIDAYIEKETPTFFEITTALAFKYFEENKIDIGVIETGLGGRLDATNLISPSASVITTISYEHTNILGETLEEIAAEKGGIIKHNTPLFIGLLKDKPRRIIENIAFEKKAELFALSEMTEMPGDFVSVKIDGMKFHIYSTPLPGKHQLTNAALAVLVYSKLSSSFNAKAVRYGLKNVVINTKFQGRYETFNETPKVIFDAAHNDEGVDIFLEEFANEKSLYDKKYLIFGAMNDKNLPAMLKKLAGDFDNIFVTTIDYERAATIEELTDIAKSNGISVTPLNDPENFINNFLKRQSNECLAVLGSIYILGEIKAKLRELELDIFP